MATDLLIVGSVIQVLLILVALCAFLAIGLGARSITPALAILALSFVGMAIRGEPAALVAVAMGTLMELRLLPHRRHRGLVEWLLVAVGLCQVALFLTTPPELSFWVAQGLGSLVMLLALAAAFAPHWWHPTGPVRREPHFLSSSDPHA